MQQIDRNNDAFRKLIREVNTLKEVVAEQGRQIDELNRTVEAHKHNAGSHMMKIG